MAALWSPPAAARRRGGDREDFATAADRICAEAARRDVPARRAAAAESGRIPERAAPQPQGGAARARPADATGGLGRRFDDFFAARHEAAIRIEDGIEAAHEGDVSALRDFRVAARERVVDAQAIAARLGLEACAGRLPAHERAAVGAAIDASIDPDGPSSSASATQPKR